MTQPAATGEPEPSVPCPPPSSFVARSQTDLIALVPVVLGFHPHESVVLLTFGAPGRAFHARVDLYADRADQEAVAETLASAVEANGVERAAVLLFGADEEVCLAQSELLVERLLDLHCEVIDAFRVHEGRWFPLPARGSPGTAYDLETHRFTAQRVLEGHVVHRDRAALAETLVGTDREDATAVALAATRYADLVLAAGDVDLVRTEARWLQSFLRRWARRPDVPLTPVVAGRLLVLASLVVTRDVAWAEIDRARAGSQVQLWRELVRRAPPHLVAGAGSLLAFAAWQHGEGALAWCALDRVHEVDPGYSMARLVAQALTGALPPGAWEPLDPATLPVFADEAASARPGDSRRARP